jgi:very-short-patch-repair endonuclease
MQNRSEGKSLRPLALAHRVAEGQEGLVTMRQLRECGISEDMLYRLLATRGWTRVLPGVFRIFGTDSWRQRCIAFSLWLGDTAALSHRGAAAWWGFDGLEQQVVELSTTSTRKSPDRDVLLHRVTEWMPADRGRSGPIWVTSPTRTLLDLGAVVSEDDLEMALESALRRRLISLPRLEWAIDRQGGRGRRGIASLRRLLAGRSRETKPTESPMETRFVQFLRRWKLPMPTRQQVMDQNGRFIGRFDFFYPEAKLLIEFDSYTHHSGRKDWSKDHTRGNEATSNWMRTMRITKELMDDEPKLARDLRRALGQGELL